MLPLLLAALAVLPAVLASSEYAKLEDRQNRGGAQEGLERVRAQYRATIQQSLGEECHPENIIVRKEWSNMSPDERQDYIRATRCLNDRPALTPQSIAPGARNRRDDFIVPHILFHQRYHFSVFTLPFHRWFITLLERALRDECGYGGGLPYMGYEKYGYQDLEYSALFDGSPTSLGTDGSPAPDGCNCVQGPFSDFSTNLGPIAGGVACRQNPQADGLGYNPRCLERKFDRTVLGNMTFENVYETIMGFDDISNFCLRLEQWPGGLHPLGHASIGAAQNEIPGSPCDPWFPVHHAGLDALWCIWQSQDPENRTYALSNPEQYNRERASRGWQPDENITPYSYLDMGPVLPGTVIGEIMSTTRGANCYVYE